MSRVPTAERRAQLVKATVALAIREGLAATTVRAIAREAGVPLGTVHYCFASKEELLEAAATELAQPFAIPVDAVLVAGESLESLLRQAFAVYWAIAEAMPERHVLTYELTTWALRRDERSVAVARGMYQAFHAMVDRFLVAMAQAASVEWVVPREIVSRMVVTVTDGVTLAWLVDRDSEMARRTLDAFAVQLVGLAR